MMSSSSGTDGVARAGGTHAPGKDMAEAGVKSSQGDYRVWAKPDTGKRRENERKTAEKVGKQGMK